MIPLKRAFAVLILLLVPSLSYSITIGPGTTCPGVACTDINVNGKGTVGIVITGYTSGTLTVTATVNGLRYDVINVFPLNSSTGQTTITANGTYRASVGSLSSIRVAFTTNAMAATAVVNNLTYLYSSSGGIGGGGGGAPLDGPFLINASAPSLTSATLVNLFQGSSVNILENRSGTTAQKFCVYKTYSSAGANFERLCIDEGANVTRHTIVGDAGGTGADRTLEIKNSNSIQIAAAPATDINFADTNGSSSFRIEVGGSASQKDFQYGNGDEVISVGTPTVANVGANSCGTDAATIAGRNIAFKVTVGATGGTQCRVSFSSTYTSLAPSCTASNESTAALVRTNSTTSRVDLLGVFAAGDIIAGVCIGR